MDNTKAGRYKAGLPGREKRRGDESKNERYFKANEEEIGGRRNKRGINP